MIKLRTKKCLTSDNYLKVKTEKDYVIIPYNSLLKNHVENWADICFWIHQTFLLQVSADFSYTMKQTYIFLIDF